MDGSVALPTANTCGACEYFDRHFGDCLAPHSTRLQTAAEAEACRAYYPSTTDLGDAL